MIRKNYKLPFITSLIIGLINYIYIMVVYLTNSDNISSTPYGEGVGTASGRWALEQIADWCDELFGVYNIPLFNCLLGIIFLAILCVILIDVLRITNKYAIVAFCSITMTFPSIAGIFLFPYTVHFYYFGLLLSGIGIYCLKLKKNKIFEFLGFIVAVFLFAVSLGIYQAFYPFIAIVLILILIADAFDDDFKIWKEILIGIKFLASLGLGYVVYRKILDYYILKNSVVLNAYEGINEMGSYGDNLLGKICEIYKIYFNLPFEDYLSLTAVLMLKITVFVSLILVPILLILGACTKKVNFKKFIWITLLLIVFPLASGFILVMVPNGVIRTRMLTGMIGIFYVPIILSSGIHDDKKNVNRVVSIFASFVIILTSISYIWLTNGNYMNLYFVNKRTENYYVTMFTRIKSAENYTEDKEIVFVGTMIDDDSLEDIWIESPFYYSEIGHSVDLGTTRAQYNDSSRYYFVANYLGYSFRYISEEESAKYQADISTMSTYPNDNCIKVVDNLVLVRIE